MQPGQIFQKEGMSELLRPIAVKLAEFVNSTAGELKELIADIIPVALPILGIVIAVFFGVKFIKKVTR